MRAIRTSVLHNRLMKGPGGIVQNTIGSVKGNSEKPAMSQVNYLVRNPTTHEISSSRLIENSKVIMTRATKSRVNSAIHRGNFNTTFNKKLQLNPASEKNIIFEDTQNLKDKLIKTLTSNGSTRMQKDYDDVIMSEKTS
jgi:hypothetical protein